MYFLLKMGIIHCYVSLPEGTTICFFSPSIRSLNLIFSSLRSGVLLTRKPVPVFSIGIPQPLPHSTDLLVLETMRAMREHEILTCRKTLNSMYRYKHHHYTRYIDRYLDLPKDAKWFRKGVNLPSLRV